MSTKTELECTLVRITNDGHNMEKVIEVMNGGKLLTTIAISTARLSGSWIYQEESEPIAGGGSLMVKGWRCPFCGNFVHKHKGRKNYCDNCGADLREEQDNGRR